MDEPYSKQSLSCFFGDHRMENFLLPPFLPGFQRWSWAVFRHSMLFIPGGGHQWTSMALSTCCDAVGGWQVSKKGSVLRNTFWLNFLF
jgi:hypothetical protein